MARIASAGTTIRINDPAIAPGVGTITEVTRAKPAALMFGAGVAPVAGDIIVPRRTGWPSLDDRPFKVAFATALYCSLEDSDTTEETAALKAGSTFDRPAWLELCRATFSLTAPAAPSADVTTLCDEAHRLVLALESLATWTAAGFYNATDAALIAARDASRSGRVVFLDVGFADASGLCFAATVNALDTTLGINQAVSNSLGGNVTSQIAFYLSPATRPVSTQWPWNDKDLIADFDFTTLTDFWSGSLGRITPAQALACERPSAGGSEFTDLAFDAQGLLVKIGPNKPRLTSAGLWCEAINAGRVDYNMTLSDPLWVKVGAPLLSQTLPSPFADGTPLGWQITATAPNTTVSQVVGVIPAAASDNFTVANAMVYWDGTPLAGRVDIYQNAVFTDIRSQLRAGRWIHVAGDIVPLDAASKTIGIRIVAAGDKVGFMLPGITRSQTVTTPVGVPATANMTRLDDMNRQVLANFPSLATKPKFTMLVVSVPRMFPFIPVGSASPNPVRRGWTVLEYNKAFTLTGTGTGKLVPYGGAHPESSLMTLDAGATGNFAIGNTVAGGTGVGSATEIMAQESGALGGPGTYRVTSPYYPNGQTTPVGIVLNCRLTDAMGYGLNAALKPDDIEHPNAQRVGWTMTNEIIRPKMNYGFDPQKNDFIYNVPNAEGVSTNNTDRKGIIALRDDLEYTKDSLYTAAVVIPEAGSEIMWGAQGFYGGNLPNGPIKRGVIIGRDLSGPELQAAVVALQVQADARAIVSVY